MGVVVPVDEIHRLQAPIHAAQCRLEVGMADQLGQIGVATPFQEARHRLEQDGGAGALDGRPGSIAGGDPAFAHDGLEVGRDLTVGQPDADLLGCVLTAPAGDHAGCAASLLGRAVHHVPLRFRVEARVPRLPGLGKQGAMRIEGFRSLGGCEDERGDGSFAEIECAAQQLVHLRDADEHDLAHRTGRLGSNRLEATEVRIDEARMFEEIDHACLRCGQRLPAPLLAIERLEQIVPGHVGEPQPLGRHLAKEPPHLFGQTHPADQILLSRWARDNPRQRVGVEAGQRLLPRQRPHQAAGRGPLHREQLVAGQAGRHHPGRPEANTDPAGDRLAEDAATSSAGERHQDAVHVGAKALGEPDRCALEGRHAFEGRRIPAEKLPIHVLPCSTLACPARTGARQGSSRQDGKRV